MFFAPSDLAGKAFEETPQPKIVDYEVTSWKGVILEMLG